MFFFCYRIIYFGKIKIWNGFTVSAFSLVILFYYFVILLLFAVYEV